MAHQRARQRVVNQSLSPPLEAREPVPPRASKKKQKTYRELWEETELEWEESQNPFCLEPEVHAVAPTPPATPLSATSATSFRRTSFSRCGDPLSSCGESSCDESSRKASPMAPRSYDRSLRLKQGSLAASTRRNSRSDCVEKACLTVSSISMTGPVTDEEGARDCQFHHTPTSSGRVGRLRASMPVPHEVLGKLSSARRSSEPQPLRLEPQTEPQSARLPQREERLRSPEVDGRSKTDPNFDKPNYQAPRHQQEPPYQRRERVVPPIGTSSKIRQSNIVPLNRISLHARRKRHSISVRTTPDGVVSL